MLNKKTFMRFKYWKGDRIEKPDPVIHKHCYLLVGTNPSGYHGAGVAKVANLYWGAKYYQGRGLCGRCYLMPTKNLKAGFYEKETGITYAKTGIRSLSREQIRNNINEFYAVASSMKGSLFIVPYDRNKRSLNGYSSDVMFELFTKDIVVPNNIVFHNSWRTYYDN